jgi:NAD(P)-dependent dehydrogenase (short-subunit alcohol dehydrogenase family)
VLAQQAQGGLQDGLPGRLVAPPSCVRSCRDGDIMAVVETPCGDNLVETLRFDNAGRHSMSKVLILGGTSGIGEATAREFAGRGNEVVVAGRDKQRLQGALERLGNGVRGQALDAGDADAVRELAASLAPIDVLVLAVSGAAGAGPFEQLAVADVRAGFDGKFWPQLTALQQALPNMADDGAIVLVTAGSARAALPGTCGLAAINGALEAMVAPLAAELAPRRVNAVSPGVIDTPWWDAQTPETRAATFEAFATHVPAGRVGRPEDVAAAIVALATNGYVTGSVLDCAGGAQLAMGPRG